MRLFLKTTALVSLCLGLIVMSACGKKEEKPEEKPAEPTQNTTTNV